MGLKGRGFRKTLGMVLVFLLAGSLAAYYVPRILKTQEVNTSHRETGVQDKPQYLGEFRVSGDLTRLSWANGKLYGLAQGEIQVYSAKGKKLKTIPIGIEVAEPTGFVAAEDRFYIADAGNQMVYVLNAQGKFWFRFPQRAPDEPRGERKVKIPGGLHRNKGVVYVTDWSDHQIKSFNSDGLPIIDFSKGQQGRLGDLAVTADGRLAVYNRDLQAVQVFTCDGRYIYDLAGQVTLQGEVLIEMDGLQRFHLLDKGANRLLVYDFLAYYLFSYGEEEVAGAQDLAINEENRLIYLLIPREKGIKVWGY